MNRPANRAVFAVVTLTEKSILPAGPRNLLSRAGCRQPPVMLDTQIWPLSVLCGRRTPSVSVWPATRLNGNGGLGLLAALPWTGATSLLFP
jgi:hypothetical protein